jgi:ribonucleotide monophosphatase NagD (HAD superfamily)
MGLDIGEAEVLTPAALAVRHCRDRGYARVALHVAPALREDLAALNDVQPGAVEAVIVGDLGDEFTYARLNTIFRQLAEGAELVALQRNRVWQREDGLVLDAGPFVVALEYAVGRKAAVTGKPSPAFFDTALAELGVQATDTATMSRLISAARWTRASTGCSCGRGNSATKRCARAESDRRSSLTRSPI